MSVISGMTMEHAVELRDKTVAAMLKIVDGTALSYKVGTREYVALTRKDLEGYLKDANDTIEYLRGNGKRNRVVRVVPRDL